jgi:hypothetical protein
MKVLDDHDASDAIIDDMYEALSPSASTESQQADACASLLGRRFPRSRLTMQAFSAECGLMRRTGGPSITPGTRPAPWRFSRSCSLGSSTAFKPRAYSLTAEAASITSRYGASVACGHALSGEPFGRFYVHGHAEAPLAPP